MHGSWHSQCAVRSCRGRIQQHMQHRHQPAACHLQSQLSWSMNSHVYVYVWQKAAACRWRAVTNPSARHKRAATHRCSSPHVNARSRPPCQCQIATPSVGARASSIHQTMHAHRHRAVPRGCRIPAAHKSTSSAAMHRVDTCRCTSFTDRRGKP